jgi:hypothetical protein
MTTLTLRGWFGAKRKDQPADPFQPTRPVGLSAGEPRVARGDLIFRLKAWPQLPDAGRTAEIYRMLSVMSSQPVNRQWLLARCRMAPHQLDQLLLKLIADGALEVIDPSRFAGRQPARA